MTPPSAETELDPEVHRVRPPGGRAAPGHPSPEAAVAAGGRGAVGPGVQGLGARRLRARRAGHLGAPPPPPRHRLPGAGRPAAPPRPGRPPLRRALPRPHRSPPPPAPRKIVIDLGRLDDIGGPTGEMLRRYLAMIQVQRQDFNGRVLTIRRDDLRAIACILDTPPDHATERLEQLGHALPGHPGPHEPAADRSLSATSARPAVSAGRPARPQRGRTTPAAIAAVSARSTPGRRAPPTGRPARRSASSHPPSGPMSTSGVARSAAPPPRSASAAPGQRGHVGEAGDRRRPRAATPDGSASPPRAPPSARRAWAAPALAASQRTTDRAATNGRIAVDAELGELLHDQLGLGRPSPARRRRRRPARRGRPRPDRRR